MFLRQSNIRNNAVFPTKFAEAITCGTPVISTNVSDLKEYEKENTIFIDNFNAEEIANAMTKMKNKSFGKKVMSRIFDYRNFEKETAEWLSCVIGGGE